MVQEFQVLRCCSCETFQVHQVKKAKTWVCKLCAQKQSYIKVYGQGSGADCRRHVQKLNMCRGQAENLVGFQAINTDVPAEQEEPHKLYQGEVASAGSSRWQAYLEPDTGEDADSEDQMVSSEAGIFTTSRNLFDKQTVLHKKQRRQRYKERRQPQSGSWYKQRLDPQSSGGINQSLHVTHNRFNERQQHQPIPSLSAANVRATTADETHGKASSDQCKQTYQSTAMFPHIDLFNRNPTSTTARPIGDNSGCNATAERETVVLGQKSQPANNMVAPVQEIGQTDRVIDAQIKKCTERGGSRSAHKPTAAAAAVISPSSKWAVFMEPTPAESSESESDEEEFYFYDDSLSMKRTLHFQETEDAENSSNSHTLDSTRNVPFTEVSAKDFIHASSMFSTEDDLDDIISQL